MEITVLVSEVPVVVLGTHPSASPLWSVERLLPLVTWRPLPSSLACTWWQWLLASSSTVESSCPSSSSLWHGKTRSPFTLGSSRPGSRHSEQPAGKQLVPSDGFYSVALSQWSLDYRVMISWSLFITKSHLKHSTCPPQCCTVFNLITELSGCSGRFLISAILL